MTNEASDRVLSIHIVGARGRMGTALIREIMSSEDLTLASAVDRSGSPGLGVDAGKLAGGLETGIMVSDELEPRRGSVVVDFSLPEATDHNVRRCAEAGVPLVCGTTGVSETTEELMREAAADIPIVYAANYSVGVTMLLRVAALAARALGPDWDAELVELHHKHKRDAPSGTALRLGHAVAAAREQEFSKTYVGDRTRRREPRGADEIGVVAMRGGDSVGEHTLMFLGEGERLELTHRARDRAIFARGALRAARWGADRDKGLFDMMDVLGL